MKTNRSSLISGLVLILLGIIFLLNYFIPNAWPVLIIGLSVVFLAAAFFLRSRGLVLPGLIILTLGVILLYQSTTNNWRSWFYLWPLIFVAVGLGMLVDYRRHSDRANSSLRSLSTRSPSGHYLRVALSFTVIGLAATAMLWVYRAQLTWPSIIYGLGGMFLLSALFSGVGPLAIPGSILGTLGILLAWQNLTGAWESWAYTWALLPASVGLGLFLAFLRSHTMRVIGLSMLGWSLVAFTLFGLIFAGNGAFSQLWPAALILAGLVILLQALFVTRRRGDKPSNFNQ